MQSGSYLTQGELVETALELLMTHEERRQIRRAFLKREVQKGIDGMDRGETVEFTAADIQRLGRERLAAAELRQAILDRLPAMLRSRLSCAGK